MILIVSVSCSKENEETECDLDPFQTITQGSWKYTQLYIEDFLVLGNGDTLRGNVLGDEESCDYKSLWIFNPDFTMSLEHDPIGCSDFQYYGDWSLEEMTLITHEEDENEYLIHTLDCVNENEISGIIEIDDTNLSIQRLEGKADFTLVKH